MSLWVLKSSLKNKPFDGFVTRLRSSYMFAANYKYRLCFLTLSKS